MPNLEYGEVNLSFKVRAKGSDKAWTQKKFVLEANGKGSVNYLTFKPADSSGLLVSTKGIYLPKATTKKTNGDS